MPYKNVKDLLSAATKLPAAIEAKLPTGAPRLSTRLLSVANKMPALPNFPVALPDLPALPAEPGLANLSGIVTDTSTRQPLSGVSVLLGAVPMPETAGLRAQTDGSGRYSFNNITLGSYQMTFSKSGYETGVTMITLHEGSNELNIQLTAPPVFDWHVYDTDHDGIITLSEYLRAVNDCVQGIITEQERDIVGWHWKNPPAVATLTGVVTDASTGTPLSGVKVTIAGVSAYTDANGQYGFTGITPGSYAVTFEKENYITLTL